MQVTHKEFVLEEPRGPDWLEFFGSSIASRLDPDETLLRFAITRSSGSHYVAEALVVRGAAKFGYPINANSIHVRRRPFEDQSSFNVALIVPTGIGAEIGGHAGDAGPVVKLLGSICDTVITHPNVVNGSDINEMPDNTLYVEGSALSLLFLGQVGLQRVRSNRVLVVIEEHADRYFINAAVNAVNAARATYGLNCPRIVQINPSVKLRSIYTSSGTAGGTVANVDELLVALRESRAEYDAVAIASVIGVPIEYHQRYFDEGGNMVNPWGGVEAMLTHTVTMLMNVPSAHAPMMEGRKILKSDPGIVDPRMAAEAISLTHLQSVLKGLQRSPRILNDAKPGQSGVIDATNVSCLVVPAGCVGIPTLAALTQGISVIFVRENKNLMENDVQLLPWRPGQMFEVANYWEAAGVIAAIKAGVNPGSVRRPLVRQQPESLNRK